MVRILVVTAVPAERDAILAGLQAIVRPEVSVSSAPSESSGRTMRTAAGLVDVIAVGVGPVAAAVGTTRQLADGGEAGGYDLVLAAGIAGGFAPRLVGSLVAADRIAHADLGADSEAGFSSMAQLGWGEVSYEPDPAVLELLLERTGAIPGAILSVSTVTGTAERAAELAADHPDAAAEAMEGIGVCLAARAFAVPFGELRAISNAVGPRDRDAWRVGDALTALGLGFAQLLAEPFPLG